MTELEKYIDSLRKLKAESPATIICLPPKTRGLPVGSYNLELLLEIIALNLEGHRPACRKDLNKIGTSKPFRRKNNGKASEKTKN